ncbi:MAG: hypothetical protein E5X34_18585 [Mesorhizobium sp.]|uniref:hypothetical protein n=1 Tax=Mesorhizobium sp. TaxID=1871066 RepID=UPI0011FBD5EB|nr:hypothetical protein [Mesorhizobium sp.]TIR20240.1 MAG: hypothetical protein E5X34_18585 [Mesorhizobium sp.]
MREREPLIGYLLRLCKGMSRKPKSNPGWVRPRKEIEQALEDQVSFMRTSAAAYDAGQHAEAVRLAVPVFILVHDGSQKSLLTQLGLRSGLRFSSFATPTRPDNLLPEEPLALMRMVGGGKSSWEPVLDQGPMAERKLQFHDWWEKEPIFQSPRGASMNRRRLVFSLRNQDGGGHVDPQLTDEAYVEFSRRPVWFENIADMTVMTDQAGKPGWSPLEPFPHLPTMRQIAFELDRTLTGAGIA